jgi:hypothetical protein
MPLSLCFEKPLALVSGMIDTRGVDTVFLICRKLAA